MKIAELKTMYAEMRYLFSPRMPKDLPIKITRAKKYAALAYWEHEEGYKKGENVGIYFGAPGMQIALKDGATWQNILMHEMCHIWEHIESPQTITYSGQWGSHSNKFFDKLRAVERLTGIKQYWNFDIDYKG